MSLAAHTAIPPLLLSATQLSGLLKSADPPRILDATWFLNMPNQAPRSGHAEYLHGPRIPGALYWDVDLVATRGEAVRNLPHMMPSASVFAEAATKHGVSPKTHVVVYDAQGIFSAPRTAFTFKAFGHEAVSVLDGGMPAWVEAGLPLDTAALKEDPHVEPATYAAPTLQENWIRSFDEMLANAKQGARAQTVLDARPAARFDGSTPEPRPGMASGHIPGARSLPFLSVLASHTTSDSRMPGCTYTTLKPQHELWKAVSDALGGGDAIEQLRHDGSAKGSAGASLSCGSGMTASILWLALQQLGVHGAIYDESWMGWGKRAADGEAPVETSQ
ncbi:hypothetical protein MVES1_003466 [Malassezia vespertilionis]|uniref:Rhodanese domain-containing protein n=1 Tax=Malassezia vespertilionis TaxID=2020962 RepID=A0A2N1J7B4_9BASI|nr:uncharacterized protein MVES1_003466 [Malassezia vespertilionis]PKI82430.1 hypothetical protein MVES_003707 [Malassezia vespertilionis]WFD08097.1 hypothetical protein MVES1_003466 [Malassezia vespertilionis]